MTGLIFGCGYLGQRVARRWRQDGWTVHAVTRKQERAHALREQGWTPIVADITKPATLKQLPTADCVLISVSPDRSAGADPFDVYVEGLRHILEHLPMGTGHLILISSTGVYGDFEGEWVDESSPTEPLRESGKACLQAEQLLHRSAWGPRSTVLRLAGIYGPGRVPTRQRIESGQWNRITSGGYLNLIHVEDAAQIVTQVSRRPAAGKTYLVSDGNPVLRKDYYQFVAQQLGIESIPWDQTVPDPTTARSGSNKRICNQALVDDFSPEWQFPDYQKGLSSILG